MVKLNCLICITLRLITGLILLYDVQTFVTENDFTIDPSQPISIRGSQFKAYDNAWYVTFDFPTTNVVLVFAVCKKQCSVFESISSRFHMLTCAEVLTVFKEPQWHNHHIAQHIENNTLCDEMRSNARDVQTGVNNILNDNSGGALVRLRLPNTVILFNDKDLVDNWMTVSNVSNVLSNELYMSLRSTEIEIVGENFGVQHHFHHLRLLSHTDLKQGAVTLSLSNRCTAAGLSAPEFGVVNSVKVAGRLRCVWECRGDMLRQPYNSEPPTKEQLNLSSVEYSLLAIKYACLPLPSSWVASVFGFTVETNLSTSDIGYAQAVFDAVDKLSVAVNQEMRAQGITGIMIFSIKNSAYHSSFTDRLSTLQQSACAVANIETAECSKDGQSVTNPNYVYRRRLFSMGYAEIEGLFISDEPSVFADASKREEHLTSLRVALVSAVVEHASLLSDTDGKAFVLSVDNIDFQEIVAFTIPKLHTSDQNKTVVTGQTNTKQVISSVKEDSSIWIISIVLVCIGALAFLLVFC
jgi:hypothetical protein